MTLSGVDLLVFGPHPDDLEIGAGGTIARHVAAGQRVGLCDLTGGEMGSNGSISERIAEAEAARSALGALWRENLRWPDRRFGKDPSHESFGAIRFEAEDPTRNSWRLDLDDHSKYFNEGTESLSNIVHVVTGDYDGVVRAPYRHEVWLLPDGINSDPETDRDPTTVG